MEPHLFEDYVRLSDRLNAYFPELASDTEFVEARCEQAHKTFCRALERGDDYGAVCEQSDAVLFSGLIFSRFSTIVEALGELYPEASYDERRSTALELFDACAPLFDHYAIDDYFESSPEYENELLPELKTTLHHLNPQIY